MVLDGRAVRPVRDGQAAGNGLQCIDTLADLVLEPRADKAQVALLLHLQLRQKAALQPVLGHRCEGEDADRLQDQHADSQLKRRESQRKDTPVGCLGSSMSSPGLVF